MAYWSARNKVNQSIDLTNVRLGMTITDLERNFGNPSDQNRNRLTYVFENNDELIVTLRDEKVANAQIIFRRAMKIEDPEMKKLTL